MIYICCVCFASLDVVCDELNDWVWNLGLSQLSDQGVYVYCVKSFADIECYSDCSRRGGIWLNPVATFFNVCSVTVECCVLCQCYVGVRGMFAVMSLQLLIGIWSCMRCPYLCLCWVLGWALC